MTFTNPTEALRWAKEQPWAAAMRECPQDPTWRAEGDVWPHAQRVTHALLELEAKQE
jgi:hypothetical protein